MNKNRRSSYLPGSYRERQAVPKSEVLLAIIAVTSAAIALTLFILLWVVS